MGYSNLKTVEWFSTQYQLMIGDDSINTWWRTRARWYLKGFQRVFLSENESNFTKKFKIIISWTVYECGVKELVFSPKRKEFSWPNLIKSIMLDGSPGRLKGWNLWVVTKWIEFYEDFYTKKLYLKYPYISHSRYAFESRKSRKMPIQL